MQATTIINIDMSGHWRVALARLEDPRIERPYVLLRFTDGGAVPDKDFFEFKLEAIEELRTVVMTLAQQMVEAEGLSEESLQEIRASVEMAILQNTQIMH